MAEMRLAFLTNEAGIFHHKVGVFQDANGARASFSGSANETPAGWQSNHESFDVFCSWQSEPDLLRTRTTTTSSRSCGRTPSLESKSRNLPQ